MAKDANFRLAGAILLALAPSAAVLIAAATIGLLSPLWVALAIVLGLAVASRVALPAARAHRDAQREVSLSSATLQRILHLARPQEVSLAEMSSRAAAQLREMSERRDEMQAVLDAMAEGVIVIGARGEIKFMNPSAREIFRVPATRESPGLSMVEISRDPAMAAFVERALASSDAVLSQDLSIMQPGIRQLRVTAAAVTGSGGRVRVLVLQDTSKLKAYEDWRTEFVANVSHELRTPLSALCGYAETLRRGVDQPETAQRFLEIILRQSRRLARLVDDLRSLSELERGLAALDPHPARPEELVEQAVELMQAAASDKGVTLKQECASELPLLEVDLDKIQQVLVNLLDNAIKYSPKGAEVTLRARGLEKNGAGAGVSFSVSDHGDGIPAQHISRLTERFYRVDQARSRELGGTGLGLAIVKHIVLLHHGDLSIESEVHRGTTVNVWLPSSHPASGALRQ